ncbi:DNA-directed RNA polymerase subunit B'' [archaeon]|nr:DNA-directed RNA polymerase subunit B'' [archaeon]|tara:strand:- start:1060 stop:2553 length:1494 start_codon:yes stop_codon:yes gene_type:complete
MVKDYQHIIQKYFDQHSIVEANLKSFDNFMEKMMQQIVNETQDIIPTIIPPEVQDFKIKLNKIVVGKPQIIEADGSVRDIYPTEARLRKLTYSSPLNLEVSAHIDGVQRDSFTAQIGKIPVMVRSKFCHLHNMNQEERIAEGEDPQDKGGYFILNGNERVLIVVEDLASNRFVVEKNNTTKKYIGKLYAEQGSYRIPHNITQLKDGLTHLSFTRFKNIPIILAIKALGLTKDKEIMAAVCGDDKTFDEITVNLINMAQIKNAEAATEELAKIVGIAQFDQKKERIDEMLDRYLLPHIGMTQDVRIQKAHTLCKLLRKFWLTTTGQLGKEDKDHYINKRLKLSGDLLGDLFRMNLRALVQDMLYNFQRLVKRGKFHSIKIIIRDNLLTSRIKSAMATGTWVGGRKGISQNLDKTNFLASMSHTQRVVSLLSATQENFAARALHPTHWGRLGPVETPEGTPIGLRKNLAILCDITSTEPSEEKIRKMLEIYGLKGVQQK